METAKLFRNGGSQAVRLPRHCRFSGTEVYVKRVGSTVILLPKTAPFEPLARSLGEFTDDFMDEREQGGRQQRDPL